MTSWTFASDPWDRDLPIDPPTTDYDRYEYQFEAWLNDNYEPETKTVFGVDADNDQQLYDVLWDAFMEQHMSRYDD